MAEIEKSQIPLPPNALPVLPKKYSNNKEYSMKGKIPPQAIELEEAVLGALMIDVKAIDKVEGILFPNMFYVDTHKIIYKAILNLRSSYTPIDILTVSTELKRLNQLGIIGGDFYLISLTQKIFSSAHIEFHARVIIQKYVLRELINQSSEIIEKSYHNDPDIFELMDNIEVGISEIYKYAINTSAVEIASDAKRELQEKINAVKAGEPPGIFTGISEFDDWSGGFQKRELITIAARPGIGKTTAVLSIAANASFIKKIPVALFSLEMNATDLKNRLAARGTGIPYNKIRQGKLDPYETLKVFEYYDFIDASSLHIIEKMNVLQVITKKIREIVTKHGVKMVMIDYVQLIKLAKKTSDRTGDLSDITRDLKALANELNIPIIILAQLSRAVDNRPNKRPQLSDLKQSGSIEEDSDTVAFLVRMAFYQQEAGVLVPPHEIGKTEFIIAKGRSTGIRSFWTFLDFINYDFRSLM